MVFGWTKIRRYGYDCVNFREEKTRILGEYISGFIIHTKAGYYIYDSPESMKYWCENYGIESDYRKRFADA